MDGARHAADAAVRGSRRHIIGFVATIGALGLVSAFFGLDRQDAFEIVAISIVWLTLVVAAGLMAVVFRRASPVEL